MKEGNSDSGNGVSRRLVIELLAGCSGYVMTIGSTAGFGAAAAGAFAGVEPSTALIRDLFGRLDTTLSQALAASHLTLIEGDYFGHVYSDRPSDLWECMETWPVEARKEAVDLLLPMIATNETLLP
jgi:hypothetical protein